MEMERTGVVFLLKTCSPVHPESAFLRVGDYCPSTKVDCAAAMIASR
jgi:hypothetical protein